MYVSDARETGIKFIVTIKRVPCQCEIEIGENAQVIESSILNEVLDFLFYFVGVSNDQFLLWVIGSDERSRCFL